MNEAMEAEFDTVAEWTAQVALDLGPSYYIPAACRGSGSPAALDWLIDSLRLDSGQVLLDCGAGLGGPAAYASRRRAVRPVLLEPELGACRAARKLFGFPVLQGSASAIPIADESCDSAWALGVLCTTSSQLALLEELRRVVRPAGGIGLLVFVKQTPEHDEQPDGNNFPSQEALDEMVCHAGMRITARRGLVDMPPARPEWQTQEEAVSAELGRRHGAKRAWCLAEDQSRRLAKLLAASRVAGELLILQRR